MKKVLFLLTLLLSLCCKAQEKQTLNLFYGYTYYVNDNNFYNFSYNYNFGIQYGFTLTQKLKLDIGSSFSTRNYFYIEYPYNPYSGWTKLTIETRLNILKLPNIHLSYRLIELNQQNKVSLFSGFEFLNILNAYDFYINETLNGEVFGELKKDLNHYDFRQTGINTLLGLSYTSTIFKRLQLRLDFCFLYNLRKDSYFGGGSSSIDLYNPRFSFESKLGVGFVLK